MSVCTDEKTMAEADQRIFCAEQINVPPELPAVLKAFTKEARFLPDFASFFDPVYSAARVCCQQRLLCC